MGRELKRVPLDFDYPLNRVWEGYLNPYYKMTQPCADCKGSGESPESKRLSDLWYGWDVKFKPEDNGSVPYTPDHPAIRAHAIRCVVMSSTNFDAGIDLYWKMYHDNTLDAWVAERPWLELPIQGEAKHFCDLSNDGWNNHLNEDDVKALLDSGRLSDFTRYPRTEEQKAEYEAVEAWNLAQRQREDNEPREWKYFHNGYTPTAKEVNDWSLSGMGHDAINQWVCVKARLKREGVKHTQCVTCKGEGTIWPSSEDKKNCRRWRKKNPPKGKGFQLWSTTGEGTPVSPVFPSLDLLCEWCAENATTFASYTATKEEWMKMLDANFVYHKEGSNIFL